VSEIRSDTAKLAALVQELGYRAQIEDDSTIKTAMSGLTVVIFNWPGDSIQLYLAFSRGQQEGFGIEQANELNRLRRFIKCYISPKAISFEQDFFFDVSKDGAKEELERILRTWEGSISSAFDALKDAQKDDRGQTGEDAPASPNA